jgi:hypothetical protein
MTFKRWLPTFLAFPIGGYLAVHTVGSVDGPLTAFAGGLVAGAIIGAAQWFALRTVSRRWIGYTAAAMAAGGALAAALDTNVVVGGLVTGAAIGAAQAGLLERGRLLWAAVTAGAWGLGWLITSNVIVDLERGYTVFGASGALVATLLTGLALRVAR